MTTSSSVKSTARDVFSYLLMIIMLYVGVVSFITLLFQYINFSFPDALDWWMNMGDEAMRRSISSLLIVWPVYILMSWLIDKDLRSDTSKREIWVRKWLLYLTLFVAALTVIIDLITLVNTFLSGEITMRFVLKVFVVLAVAVMVFSFYFWELRRDPAQKQNITFWSALASSILILGCVIAGFFIVGSPAKQRAVRMDDQRVVDLQSIQSQVLSFWIQKETLPSSLDELQDPFSGYQAPQDPLTDENYSYTVKGELEFELCANFETEMSPQMMGKNVYPQPMNLGYQDSSFDTWSHGMGMTCFTRTIDPELYEDQGGIVAPRK